MRSLANCWLRVCTWGSRICLWLRERESEKERERESVCVCVCVCVCVSKYLIQCLTYPTSSLSENLSQRSRFNSRPLSRSHTILSLICTVTQIMNDTCKGKCKFSCQNLKDFLSNLIHYLCITLCSRSHSTFNSFKVCLLWDTTSCICWPSPSNQSFYKQIAGYQRDVPISVLHAHTMYNMRISIWAISTCRVYWLYTRSMKYQQSLFIDKSNTKGTLVNTTLYSEHINHCS